MEPTQFDTLARSFRTDHTRRGMTRLLGGLALGAPLALVGLGKAAARCKKQCGPCKRCKNGKCKPKPAGTACAGGTCQGGTCISAAPPPCVPQDPAAVCAAGCGTRKDNCGRTVVCPCPGGRACLSNGSCAEVCVESANCPGDCACSNLNAEDKQVCVEFGLTCADVPQSCESTAKCPQGRHCQLVTCGPGGVLVKRCVPLCEA